MRIYGKVFGAIIGWMLLRHPAGLLIGAALGHLLDSGWLTRERSGRTDVDDAYRTLGCEPDCTDEDLDRAYRRMIGQYHPDKVAGAADEIRRLAEQRATAINLAYETIQKQRRYPR